MLEYIETLSTSSATAVISPLQGAFEGVDDDIADKIVEFKYLNCLNIEKLMSKIHNMNNL